MALSAVITADIVNSTLLSDDAAAGLKASLAAAVKPNRYEFYRGDSFQVLLKKPQMALRTALMIRTHARMISPNNDVRCSIGIGELHASPKKLSAANDEVFVISGRAFDSLRAPHQHLIITCPDTEENKKVNLGLCVLAHFVDYLVSQTTPKQAAVLQQLLQANTQQTAARNLGKSVSTINKHAHAAGWQEMEKLLTDYEQFIQMLEYGNSLVS